MWWWVDLPTIYPHTPSPTLKVGLRGRLFNGDTHKLYEYLLLSSSVLWIRTTPMGYEPNMQPFTPSRDIKKSVSC